MFKCTTCDKTFASNAGLKYHITKSKKKCTIVKEILPEEAEILPKKVDELKDETVEEPTDDDAEIKARIHNLLEDEFREFQKSTHMYLMGMFDELVNTVDKFIIKKVNEKGTQIRNDLSDEITDKIQTALQADIKKDPEPTEAELNDTSQAALKNILKWEIKKEIRKEFKLELVAELIKAFQTGRLKFTQNTNNTVNYYLSKDYIDTLTEEQKKCFVIGGGPPTNQETV